MSRSPDRPRRRPLQPAARQRRARRWSTAWGALAAALLLHLLGLGALHAAWPWLAKVPGAKGAPASLVILQPTEPPEDPLEDAPEPELDGQIVEIAKPVEEQRPEDADYLSEYDQTVPEETRTDRFTVNPEVLAPTYSREQKAQQEDLVDLDMDKPSTGATVGNKRFDPARDGNLAALPSPWTRTNKDGLQDPVPSSHAASALSGAPQNDLLDEQIGDSVALNTKEYLFASYLKRIRRLVNFYWEQNLDSLPGSVVLTRPSYTTVVNVVLDAEGALEIVEVTRACGLDPLDHAVVRAFQLAGPFPNPPAGLIEKDGRVYLPDFGFTVTPGTAMMRYQGVDPRSGVQFPGIMKSPR